MDQHPFILITNDDGYRAEGIQVLRNALCQLGEPIIVAPLEEKSAGSHSLTIHDPVRVRRIDEGTLAVRGTPADCVILALRELLPRPPALVISGINHGSNLGDDIMYSGTVAGAREACYLDVPAFSISQQMREETADFAAAASVACAVARLILQQGLPSGSFLNVNVPAERARGWRWTRQGARISKSNVIANRDPRGRPYYWIGDERHEEQESPLDDSDYAAIRQGYVSLTPLHRDQTDHRALDAFRGNNLLDNFSL